MGFMEAVRVCLREKYLTKSGRASRSEYWYFYLFMFLCWIALYAIFLLAGGANYLVFDPSSGQFGNVGVVTIVVGALCVAAFLYLVIAQITVTIRRFHDRNLSGWWVLAGFVLGAVPFVGIIVSIAMLVILVLKGTDGDNKYGPDPLKMQNSADVFA